MQFKGLGFFPTSIFEVQNFQSALKKQNLVPDSIACWYNVIDSRYLSRKPLIVTTNLTLDEIRHPQDTAHARIYDRLLEMCVPLSCIGISLRKETAQEKLERLKLLIG